MTNPAQFFRSAAVLALLMGSLGTSAHSQALSVSVSGNPGNYQLSWPSKTAHFYQIIQSTNLMSWNDTGFFESGSGNPLTSIPILQSPQVYYQVVEIAGTVNTGFLLQPTNNHSVDLIDGVCFSFDLNQFSQLPGRIRVYQRPMGGTWNHIGTVTEFAEISSIRFVRGSTAWVPEAEGNYEVKAEVLDGAGRLVGHAQRTVSVETNEAPVIGITGGPPNTSATARLASFGTIIIDPEMDPIRRVEFFDNGVLIGVDREAPFGDQVRDLEDRGYDLAKGTHVITARAFDSRGGVGDSTNAYTVNITAGNSRPTVAVSPPTDGFIVQSGESFELVCTAADPDGDSDVARIEFYDLSDNARRAMQSGSSATFAVDTTGWEAGTHTLRVFSVDAANLSSYPLYFRVFVAAAGGESFAQRMVANMVDESTAAPTNEVFHGIQLSTDIFTGGMASGLQMDSGVLLTTGEYVLWNGGDDDFDEEEKEKVWNAQGDQDLETRVSGRLTRDAAVIEFDLFCQHSQLEFEYQFGSEEYDEYVGQFNDGFMVTVDGVLVSFVPDCSGIVAVNSVNPIDLVNEHLYLDDDDHIDPTVAPANQAFQVEYDGMTIRMKAHALVTPNKTHRIRLVIADVNDAKLDSGLFVKEGSIRTVEPAP